MGFPPHQGKWEQSTSAPPKPIKRKWMGVVDRLGVEKLGLHPSSFPLKELCPSGLFAALEVFFSWVTPGPTTPFQLSPVALAVPHFAICSLVEVASGEHWWFQRHLQFFFVACPFCSCLNGNLNLFRVDGDTHVPLFMGT